MLVKRMSLIIFCGLLFGSASQSAMIVDGLWNPAAGLDPDASPYEQNATLKTITMVTDFGFLVENLRGLGSCLTSAHCRWTGRAISWWTYDDSANAAVDTTNVLSPGTWAPGVRETPWPSGSPIGILQSASFSYGAL
jgi:hypothetical protein